MKLSLFVLLIGMTAFAQNKPSLFDKSFEDMIQENARREEATLAAREAQRVADQVRSVPPPKIQQMTMEADVRRTVERAVRTQNTVAAKCQYSVSPYNSVTSLFTSNILPDPVVTAVNFRASVPQATYEFKPTVMIDNASGWTAKEVNDALEKVSKIYSQCGIRIGAATVVTGTYNPRLRPYDDNSQASMAYHMPDAPKPWLFFIDHRKQSEFNGGAGTSAAFTSDSTGRTALGGNRFMKGAAFIAHDSVVKADGKPTGYRPEFVIGHELAHILTDGDHQPGENGDPKHLLADNGNNINGKITAAECAQMRSSPFVHKL